MKYGTPLARLLATCCSLVAIVALSGNTGADCSGGGRTDTSCVTSADCEGLGQPKCDGQWACLANECVFDCQIDPPPVTCLQSGCSGEVCGSADAAPAVTSCEWKDWFGCLGLTKCGAFNADGTCGFDQNAEFLACVEKASGCLSNADCPAGFRCLLADCGFDANQADYVGGAGVCEKIPDHTGCIDDAQCAKGQTCRILEVCAACAKAPDSTDAMPCFAPCTTVGECVNVDPVCYSDADCPSGSVCQIDYTSAKCGTEPAYGSEAAPEKCMPAGVCVAGPRTCYGDYDCPTGQFCQVDYSLGCGTMAGDAPSPAREGETAEAVCMPQGVCTDAPTDCRSSEDCPAGWYCQIDSVCPPCAPCACDSHDSDCACTTCDCLVPEFGTCVQACVDNDWDGACANIDCNDWDASVSPYNVELCGNYRDDDCDGLVDEDCGIQCYQNADCPAGWTCQAAMCGGDYEGAPAEDAKCAGPFVCVPPATTCSWDGDCPAGLRCVFPYVYAARPSCVDESGERIPGCTDEMPVPVELGTCCVDADWDNVCAPQDCNDYDAGVFPGAYESCDGRDNDCDGMIDEGCEVPGLCWTDADCKAGYRCDNLVNCGPNTNCMGPYECVPAGDIPCGSDAECPAGMQCAYAACEPCSCDSAGNCYCPPCPIDGVCVSACVPEVCGDGLDNDCDGMVDESCGAGCTTDADCGPGEYCEITSWCDGDVPTDPSGGWCTGSGVCKPYANPTCRADEDCAAGEYCLIQPFMNGAKCCMPGEVCPMIYLPCEGTCQPAPDPVCWADADCPAGMRCENNVDCGGMGADCVGPFQCVPAPLPDCKVVKPGSHGACAMFLGWAFDGVKCFAEGGCGCGADCDALFQTEYQCMSACYLVD